MNKAVISHVARVSALLLERPLLVSVRITYAGGEHVLKSTGLVRVARLEWD